jgi:hypothetical protein
MFWLLGAYALYILKYIFDIFHLKNKIKISHVHLHVLYAHKIVARQMECHVACVKKIIFYSKNKAFHTIVFIFFT